MNRDRGQALVELAVTMPVLLLLALGGVALARLADARAGLDAATAAAAAEAARAQDPTSAGAAAERRFATVIAPYPVDRGALLVDLGDFQRGGLVRATGSATVSLAFAPLPGLPRAIGLRSRAEAVIEPWRSRVSPGSEFPSPVPVPVRSGCSFGCPAGG